MSPSAFNCLFIALTAPLAWAAMLPVHESTVIEAQQSGLPPGWSVFGCYSDIPASRTLRVASFTDVTNMTIESCLAFCTPAGYKFAGVEFARECYCDNIIESPGVPIDSSTCNTPCTGNPNEICGGTGAINIFQKSAPTPTPPGWSVVGCYSDIPASRTLRVASFTDVTNMTIESCLAFCTPAGYMFAGVEFARECYCDNIIESPGVPIGSSTCSTPCTGNPNEICGGTGAINIFQKSAPPPPPPPPSATIKQTAGSFQYKGCYQDGVNGAPRSLRTQLSVSGVTAETCTAACKAAGFILAGLEFGQECWCDSYMPLAVSTPDTECNMVCNADTTELCGAGNRLAVYVDSSAPAMNSKTCLSSAQLHGVSNEFELVAAFVPAFPGAPVRDPLPLGNAELASHPEVPTTDVLTGRSDNSPHVYGIFTDGIHTFAFNGFDDSVSIQPLNGGSQFFQVHGTGAPFVTFSDYCAQPNLLAPSTYIGPPVLAVSGHSDVWGFCEFGILYLPLGPGNCSSILLEMIGVTG